MVSRPDKGVDLQVVETAFAAPGCCRICRHADGPFIDTFRVEDGPAAHPAFGRVYVCKSCVSTFAREFGLLDEAAAPLIAELEATREELESVREDADFVAAVRKLQDELTGRLPKRRPGRPRKKTKAS